MIEGPSNDRLETRGLVPLETQRLSSHFAYRIRISRPRRHAFRDWQRRRSDGSVNVSGAHQQEPSRKPDIVERREQVVSAQEVDLESFEWIVERPRHKSLSCEVEHGGRADLRD